MVAEEDRTYRHAMSGGSYVGILPSGAALSFFGSWTLMNIPPRRWSLLRNRCEVAASDQIVSVLIDRDGDTFAAWIGRTFQRSVRQDTNDVKPTDLAA